MDGRRGAGRAVTGALAAAAATMGEWLGGLTICVHSRPREVRDFLSRFAVDSHDALEGVVGVCRCSASTEHVSAHASSMVPWSRGERRYALLGW